MNSIAEKISRYQLCRDVVSDWLVEDQYSVLITHFRLPNRDNVVLFAEEGAGTVHLSDRGSSLRYLVERSFEMTESRLSIIHGICKTFDCSVKQTEIEVTAKTPTDVASAVFRLGQAIAAITGFLFHRETHHRSTLPSRVDQIIAEDAPELATVDRDWHEPRLDPAGAFSIDRRINGSVQPKALFFVTSPNKVMHVAATSQFLRANEINLPSIVVVDPYSPIGPKDQARLQMSVNEIIFDIDKQRDRLLDFLYFV